MQKYILKEICRCINCKGFCPRRNLCAVASKILEEIIETELDAFPFLTKNYKVQLRDRLTESVLFHIENELN